MCGIIQYTFHITDNGKERKRERKREGLVESSYQVLAGILHVRERVGVTAVVAVLKTTQGSQLSAENAV